MAEQGFVGLGLFCGLIIAIYRSCAVVQKRVRGHEELAWAADLARATQHRSLVAFAVGGCFVSIASNPFLYMLAGIAIGTRSSRRTRVGQLRRGVRLYGSVAQPAERFATKSQGRPVRNTLSAKHTAAANQRIANNRVMLMRNHVLPLIGPGDLLVTGRLGRTATRWHGDAMSYELDWNVAVYCQNEEKRPARAASSASSPR